MRRRKLQGGCACGEVRYELKREPMTVHCCHCHLCQKQTGSAFVINAIIETDQLEVTGKVEAVEVPRPSVPDKPHDILRCARCKVAVFSDYGRRPGIRFVRVGTLDDPKALKPDVHIFTRAKQPWVTLPKSQPQFRDFYPDPKKIWSDEARRRWKRALVAGRQK